MKPRLFGGIGPPIPDVPWGVPGGGAIPAGGGTGTEPVPDVPDDDVLQPGTEKPFLPRVPDAETRLRRNTDMSAEILNSLMRRGYLLQDDPRRWKIVTDAGSTTGLTGTFDSGEFP